MSFHKKTVKDIDITGKRTLVRVDYNVPIKDGQVDDDYRIKQSLPTIQYLLEKKCTIVLMSHLGRPEGRPTAEFSLKPVAKVLEKLVRKPVKFIEDCVGGSVTAAVASAKPGDILLLENVRFHPGEEKEEEAFAKSLVESTNSEVFIQDCFGVAHRPHASIVGVTKFLPSVAGLLLEKEVDTITTVMDKPERPLVAIVGGAKISDKIDILERFIDIADFVAVGGAMANTFLLALDISIGKSLAEPDDIPIAKEIIDKARQKASKQPFIFYLPQDGVVANKIDKTVHTRIVDWDAHVIASIEHYPKRPPKSSGHVGENEMILDIGPFSGSFIAGGLQLAKTVIWNGAMGVTETSGLQGPIGPFAHGTEIVVDAMLGQYGSKPFSVVGGGDTVAFIEDRGLTGAFGHVSTGGGASLELMSGKTLPGVEALLNK